MSGSADWEERMVVCGEGPEVSSGSGQEMETQALAMAEGARRW